MLHYQPLIFLFIPNFFFTLQVDLLEEIDLILAIYTGEESHIAYHSFFTFFSKQKAATCARMRIIRSNFFFCNKRSILDTETDGDEKSVFSICKQKKRGPKRAMGCVFLHSGTICFDWPMADSVSVQETCSKIVISFAFLHKNYTFLLIYIYIFKVNLFLKAPWCSIWLSFPILLQSSFQTVSPSFLHSHSCLFVLNNPPH